MRFNPLPPSMSTLVSRKPSTIGPRTSAAGARAVQNLGSSLALKVIAVSLQGFIAATWQISAMLRSVRLRLLFDVKVSKTVNTVLLFEANVLKTVSTLRSSSSGGCCSAVFLVRISSPLLAACRSIQHALRLWLDMVSGVVCILHGPSSHPSRTVPRPMLDLYFFTIEPGVL